jgi:SRSO17 transposase
MPAGVARQYTGTAGRVENCQVGVFAAHVTPDGGRALIDRELYLPKKWVSDRDRCKAAGIGDSVGFATKPELARRMIERAAAARVPLSWVVGDEVYGGNPQLRGWLEEQLVRGRAAMGPHGHRRLHRRRAAGLAVAAAQLAAARRLHVRRRGRACDHRGSQRDPDSRPGAFGIKWS